MGAAIAFGLGARYPGIPAALVLEDPPWFDASPTPLRAQPGRPNPMAQLVEHWQSLTVEQIIAETHLEHSNWSELITQRWCAAKKQLDPNFLATNSFPRANWRTALKKIACPTLLITADPALGGIVTPAMAQAAQQINSQVQVVHFPGVGHHIRFAVHAEYLQSLKVFLSSLAG